MSILYAHPLSACTEAEIPTFQDHASRPVLIDVQNINMKYAKDWSNAATFYLARYHQKKWHVHHKNRKENILE